MKKNRKINSLFVHCSATPPNRDVKAETIYKWHRDLGWKDIGYHYVIERDGTLRHGRPVNTAGAHCKGHNQHSIGICLVGGICGGDVCTDTSHKAQGFVSGQFGVPEDNFTEAQFKSLKKLLNALRVLYPDTSIHAHNEYSNKACPSFDLKAWLQKEGIRKV